MRAEVARRVHDTAPEYYDIEATDFQDAGWSALTAVVEGALSTLETWEIPDTFAPALAAESLAAARNGLPWITLARTYHLTHQVIWDMLLTEAGTGQRSREEPRTLKVISDLLFKYFDYLTTEAGELYFQSAASIQGSRDRRKRQAVMRVLDGAALNDNELGYRLNQSHIAVTGWGGEPREVIAAIGLRLGAETLVVSVEDGVVWGWWGSAETVDPLMIDAVVPAHSSSLLMIGAAERGRSGFVASHQQSKMIASLHARKLMSQESGVAHFADHALVAVGTANETIARLFVQHELRALIDDDGRAALLRRTLRQYSESGMNAGRAAASLGIAERSLRYRLTELEDTLGLDFRCRMPELVTAIEMFDALNVQQGRHTTPLSEKKTDTGSG